MSGIIVMFIGVDMVILGFKLGVILSDDELVFEVIVSDGIDFVLE